MTRNDGGGGQHRPYLVRHKMIFRLNIIALPTEHEYMSKEINFMLDDWHFFFSSIGSDEIQSYLVTLFEMPYATSTFSHMFYCCQCGAGAIPFLHTTAAIPIGTKSGTNILNQKATLTHKNPLALLDLIYASFFFEEGGIQLTANNVIERATNR